MWERSCSRNLTKQGYPSRLTPCDCYSLTALERVAGGGRRRVIVLCTSAKLRACSVCAARGKIQDALELGVGVDQIRSLVSVGGLIRSQAVSRGQARPSGGGRHGVEATDSPQLRERFGENNCAKNRAARRGNKEEQKINSIHARKAATQLLGEQKARGYSRQILSVCSCRSPASESPVCTQPNYSSATT